MAAEGERPLSNLLKFYATRNLQLPEQVDALERGRTELRPREQELKQIEDELDGALNKLRITIEGRERAELEQQGNEQGDGRGDATSLEELKDTFLNHTTAFTEGKNKLAQYRGRIDQFVDNAMEVQENPVRQVFVLRHGAQQVRMTSKDGTQNKEVLELKRKLSQCQREKERLINEKNRWTIKEKLLKRELENVEEKLSAEKEADLNARSEFKKTQETLSEALETKNKSVRQHTDELIEKLREIQCPLSPKDNAKFDRLSDDFRKKLLQSREEADKLHMLSSAMQKNRQELYGFQETFLKNFKINPTAGVTTFLRDHFPAYFDTLKIGEHGSKMLTDFMYFTLKLDVAQREHEKFAAVDFKSSISAGVSKIFNFFSRKQTNSSGAVVHDTSSVGKMLRYMIGKNIWNKDTR